MQQAQATVKYIVNGYTVSGFPAVATGEMPDFQSHYATTLEEAMYWVGQLMEPSAGDPPVTQRGVIELSTASDDPLMNQEAEVIPLTTGGYLVRQMMNPLIVTRQTSYEACTSLDQVFVVLQQIFTAPPPALMMQEIAARMPFELEPEE